MKKESIEMVSYEKLSYQSDAFLDLNGLEPFINFIVDENYSTQILSLDKYTAGSSDNPDDFSLPEHKHITKPESLLRLNPFNNINKSSILLRSSNDIAKSYPFIEISSKEEIQDIPYIADEALELLKYFENNFIDLANTKKYDYGSLSVIEKINKYVILLLNERYFSQGTSSTNEILNLPMTENVKDYGFDPLNPKSLNSQNITNNQNNTENLINNEIDNIFNTTQNNISLENSKYVYNSKNVSFKNSILNRNKSVRFTIQNITQNYISEVKIEILESVTNMVSVLENKIKTENITKIEVNNIKNEVISYFENKLESHTEKALQVHEAKTKAEIKTMFKSFLNS
jgi:hypothetical protein